MNNLAHNFAKVQTKILSATKNSPFKQEVQLIAVSKTVAQQKIRELYQLGHRDFAENYAQELHEKAILLRQLNIQWHFIGTIQSNKTKIIAKDATWVHSLEYAKHALSLNNYRPSNLPPLNLLIEVNISNSLTKHGLTTLAEIVNLASLVLNQPNLRLRGLMGIASNTLDKTLIASQFNQLKSFFTQLNAQGYGLDTLSMGMSHDYLTAITCGATMVRIGSLIFGARNHAK